MKIKTKWAEYEITAEGFSDNGEDVFSCRAIEGSCLSCDHICEIGMMNRILGVGE